MRYYKTKPAGYYNNPRKELLNFIQGAPQKVLDVGCGDGSFAVQVKQKYNAETWGIEYVTEEAGKAGKILDRSFAGPCEDHIAALPDQFFDVIFFNDVLEHLVDPYTVLEEIRSKLAPGGIIIASIPNVRYFKVLSALMLRKDWKYEDYGVMDKTHLRFFTKKSMQRMFHDAGYHCCKTKGLSTTRSLKFLLFTLCTFFTQWDARYGQYGIVAVSK